MLLKKDESSKANLLSILRKINDHLEEKQSRFLTGETMCCFDCELMPKLQHIRVAGEFFADFHIPGKKRHLSDLPVGYKNCTVLFLGSKIFEPGWIV